MPAMLAEVSDHTPTRRIQSVMTTAESLIRNRSRRGVGPAERMSICGSKYARAVREEKLEPSKERRVV